MTPSKSKKALPSSTATMFPDQPVTREQWAMALQRLKALYLRGQFRPCAARCDQLLSETKTMVKRGDGLPSITGFTDDDIQPNPLFASYLHFYSALSTESLARLAHNLSASKIPTLLQAKESYQKAASSLPPRDHFSHPLVHQTDDAASELSSPDSDSAHDCSNPSPLSPNSPPSSPSPSSVDPHDSFGAYPPVKRPSPLRINKKPTLRLITSISTPPHTPPTQLSPDFSSRSASITFSATTSIWLRSRARERFNAQLDSFRDMIARHVDVIEGLVRAAEEAQKNRWTRKHLGMSTAHFGDGDNWGDEDRKSAAGAVIRGRERGWARPRFQPERYKALCEQALSEL